MTLLSLLIKKTKEIQNALNQLPAPELLKERIIYTYALKVAYQLERLFTEIEDKDRQSQLDALKTFLANNWLFVKNNMLSYTVLSKHEITVFLGEIAKYIVNEGVSLQPFNSSIRPLGILEVLMPGVCLESLFPNKYRHLYPCLITISTEKVEWQDVNLDEILNTHILSANQRYLIPVELLATDHKKDFIGQCNPYYDFEIHDESDVFLNAESYKRLTKHSSLARVVGEAQLEYETIAYDKGNLLGQLNHLINVLYLNSAHVLGIELAAAEGAYVAIAQFIEYYDYLKKDQIDLIPTLLKKEIETLRHFTAMKDNESNIGSCLATRRTELQLAVNQAEIVLHQISLDPNKRNEFIQIAQKNLEDAKTTLLEKMKNYSGEDSLPLTSYLMDQLRVSCEIKTKADLSLFSALSSDELNMVLGEKPLLAVQALKVLENLENLIFFAIELSLEQLEAWIYHMKPSIKEILLLNQRYLVALLIPLDRERVEIIGRSLGEVLFELIPSTNIFSDVMQRLATEQQNVILKLMWNRLPTFIQHPLDFRDILKYLSIPSRDLVFDLMREKLSQLTYDTGTIPIFSSSEQSRVSNLQEIIRYLSTDQVKLYIEDLDLNYGLSKIISNVWFFDDIMKYSYVEQNMPVFEALYAQVLGFCNTAENFEKVLSHLTPEQGAMVFESMSEKLLELVHDGVDFKQVLYYLNPQQRQKILEKVQAQLGTIIEKASDFRNVLELLTLKQRAIVFEIIKNKLSLIQHPWEFTSLMECLLPEQRTLVFEKLGDRLPKLILDSHYFHCVSKYLTSEQSTVLCKSLGAKLSDMIRCRISFVEVVYYLNEEQRQEIFELVKSRLPAMIQELTDFLQIFKYLSVNQKEELFYLVHKQLSEMIRYKWNCQVIESLTVEQGMVLLDDLRDKLPRILSDKASFDSMLEYLSIEQQALAFDIMSEHLSRIFETPDHILKVLQVLPLENCRNFVLKLKDFNLFVQYKPVITPFLNEEKIKFINEVHQLEKSTAPLFFKKNSSEENTIREEKSQMGHSPFKF